MEGEIFIERGPRPTHNFYWLDKRISEDKRLSWATRGMLIFLLGKPDTWKVSVTALINETADARLSTGRDAVRAMMKELIDTGYVLRKRSADGTIRYFITEFGARSQDKAGPEPEPGNTFVAEPETPNPGPPNPGPGNTGPLVRTDKAVRTEKAAKTKAVFVLPDWITPSSWADFEQMRVKRKKPLTDRAKTLAIGVLAKLRDAGQDVDAVIDQTVLHSWDSFYGVKTDVARISTGSGGREARFEN